MGRLLLALAIFLCLAWAGAVAYEAWAGWPHFSLDLGFEDPATRAAHKRAIIMHVASHAAAGLVPLIAVSVIAGLFRRSRARQLG